MPPRPESTQIRQYILDYLVEPRQDLVAHVAEHFRITRQAIHRHLKALEAAGAIVASGKTRARTYQLAELERFEARFAIAGLQEHVPWEREIQPRLLGVPRNILDICRYGFTEILNNAIDHSESELVLVRLTRSAATVDLTISDAGVGIFNKIKTVFGLADELQAITELAKGKLTTDPQHHTGEGIFFTSRVFDVFKILSGQLYFSHVRPSNAWLIEDRGESCPGTYVRMTIATSSRLVLKTVFDEFASGDHEYEFAKTHVPVRLLQYGSDQLVSRSQAKRLLGRFEMFREVLLDFTGVEEIGQAFADEIFRVYATEHPEVHLTHANASPSVRDMIVRAIGRRQTHHDRP